MKYNVSLINTPDKFVSFEFVIHTQGVTALKVQLPSWRPGRYELANYARNIRNFEIRNEREEAVSFEKITKDCWLVNSVGSNRLVITYEYYANQADAGASYVSETLLYLNPVNCFMYVVGRENEAFEVQLNIPENWQIACQLNRQGSKLMAPDFDTLADSPFFASSKLVHHVFNVDATRIHFWFEGGSAPDIDRLEKDTVLYTRAQVSLFGDMPLKDYHFLYLILPGKFRHGVEHANSTVIAMGPAEDFVNENFYHDFLAISSHELFHLWNIKRIRPAEMWPYDFTRENYSRLGYVYEGVTTYYGDLMLYRCGIWDFNRYAASLASDLDRHFNNPGRFNYSVASSSFDTWLDGYVPGVSGRKVSIYMEGLVAALIADVMILEATNGNARLDQVMRRLYEETWLKNKPYTESLYKHLLEEVSGLNFDAYFNEIINGKGHWDKWIFPTLEKLGIQLNTATLPDGTVKCEIVKLSAVNNKQKALLDNWTKCTYFATV